MRTASTLILIAALAVAGCSPPTGNPKLLGKWQTPTGGTMEFKRGGTVTMSGPNGSVDVGYGLLDATTIELRKKDGSGRPLQRRIESLTDEVLVLTDEQGPQRLRRVP